MEQTNLTPEQYKKLAKFAGYDVIKRKGVILAKDKLRGRFIYTPDTNDAQHLELLKAYTRHYLECKAKAMNDNVVCDNWVHVDYILDPLKLCHAVLALEGEG